MRSKDTQKLIKRGCKAPLRIVVTVALASGMVPVASLAASTQPLEAVAESSITETSALSHMSDTAPECVQECILGYLDGTIDKTALESALVDLAEEGRITNTQLNAYLELLGNDDMDALKALCATSSDDASAGSASEGGSTSGKNDGENDADAKDDAQTGADTPASGDSSSQDTPDSSDTEGDGSEGDDASDGSDGTDGDVEGEDPSDPTDSTDVPETPSIEAPSTPVAPTDETEAPNTVKHPLSNSSNKSASKDDKDVTEANKGDNAKPVKVVRATHDMTTEQFIAVIGEQARQIGQDSDLYASVMIAQAILESGSGSSLLSSAPFHNLFGIKGTFNGKGVQMKTQEDDGEGNYYTITATFRDYSSYSESLNDYANLLTVQSAEFYAGALKSNAETPYDAAEFLQGRYATSTSYAASLTALIDTYDLTRYDEPLPYEPDEKYSVDVIGADGNMVSEERTVADLLAVATSYLGTDYVWGGNSPETGFDCSGLVQYSYSEALGVSLPRTTYVQCKVGEQADLEDLHPGDLLFFERDDDVHHVGMYLGNGFFIHAPQTGDVVKVTALEDYPPSFAMRVIPTHERGKKVEPKQAGSDAVEKAADDITSALDSVMWNMTSSISDSVAVIIEND